MYLRVNIGPVDQISPAAPDQWLHNMEVWFQLILFGIARGESLYPNERYVLYAVSQSNWNERQAVSHTKYPKTHMDNQAKDIGNQLHYNFVLTSSRILHISNWVTAILR